VSVERRMLLALPLVLASVAAVEAMGADSEEPDGDFLEYLGSWEEGDEEWVTLAEEKEPSSDTGDTVKRRDTRKDDEQES